MVLAKKEKGQPGSAHRNTSGVAGLGQGQVQSKPSDHCHERKTRSPWVDEEAEPPRPQKVWTQRCPSHRVCGEGSGDPAPRAHASLWPWSPRPRVVVCMGRVGSKGSRASFRRERSHAVRLSEAGPQLALSGGVGVGSVGVGSVAVPFAVSFCCYEKLPQTCWQRNCWCFQGIHKATRSPAMAGGLQSPVLSHCVLVGPVVPRPCGSEQAHVALGAGRQ